MKQITKIVNIIAKISLWISIIMMVAIVILIVTDIILRYVFRNPITGGYEIVELLLLMAISFSLAAGQIKRQHVHMTILVNALPLKLRMLCQGVFFLLTTVTVGLLTYGGWLQAVSIQKSGFYTQIVKIPYYPFEYFCSIGLGIFTLTLLWDTIRCFIGIFRKDIAEEVKLG